MVLSFALFDVDYPSMDNSKHIAVSVLVPLYNVEAYVAQCLQSLLDQSFTDFEVICVDDCSTDNTLEVARATVGDDARFTFVVRKENGRQGAARNEALKLACGKYIALLDSDDYFTPDALEKMVSRMESQHLDELYLSANTFYEDNASYKTYTEDYSINFNNDEVMTGREMFCFWEQRGDWIPSALRCIRKSLLDEYAIVYPEQVLYEDQLFCFMVAAYSKRSAIMSDDVYMRRVHFGSTMAQPRRTLRSVKDYRYSLEIMDEWIAANVHTFDETFSNALAQRMAKDRSAIGLWWHYDLTDDEHSSYLTSLTPEDRWRFLDTYVAPGRPIYDKDQEYLASATYRTGDALLSTPRKLASSVRERRLVP